MTNEKSEVERTIDAAASDILGTDPLPFSPRAFELIKQKVSAYIRSLIDESSRISRRQRSDQISAFNVEQASNRLFAESSQRWSRNIGTTGGIFLGVSLSNFLSMITSNVYTTEGVVVSVGLSIIGAFGIALHIGKEE